MSRRTLLFALGRVVGWLIVPLYVARAVGPEAFYHHLPLSLLIPRVLEESFLIRIILIASYSLQRIFMHHVVLSSMLRAGGRVGPRPDRPALFSSVKVNFVESPSTHSGE
jgi:hypothetical protein